MKTEDKRLEEVRARDVPRHVAIIMDGNGRWARQRGWPRMRGYPVGMDSLREVCRVAVRAGVEVLTLFAFSKANWKRPAEQVFSLMRMLEHYADREIEGLQQLGIRVTHIGDLDGLPKSTRRAIRRACEETQDGGELTVVLAINYSARWELARATRAIAADVASGAVRADEVDEDLIAAHLTTNRWPDPELMIRTSGEQRLSDFLLWQLAFTELYLTDVLWPDFRAAHFLDAIEEYQHRERTFGALPLAERGA